MSPIAVVAFDIDDTLYLERDYVRQRLPGRRRLVSRTSGPARFSRVGLGGFSTRARRDIFDRVLRQWGVPIEPSLIGQLVDVYRRHDPQIDLLPDAAECLARLRGRVKLAAISDGPPASQQAKVRRLGLDRWMDEIVLTGVLGPGFEKPSLKAFLEDSRDFSVCRLAVRLRGRQPCQGLSRPAAAWDDGDSRAASGGPSLSPRSVLSGRCAPFQHLKSRRSAGGAHQEVKKSLARQHPWRAGLRAD